MSYKDLLQVSEGAIETLYVTGGGADTMNVLLRPTTDVLGGNTETYYIDHRGWCRRYGCYNLLQMSKGVIQRLYVTRGGADTMDVLQRPTTDVKGGDTDSMYVTGDSADTMDVPQRPTTDVKEGDTDTMYVTGSSADPMDALQRPTTDVIRGNTDTIYVTGGGEDTMGVLQ